MQVDRRSLLSVGAGAGLGAFATAAAAGPGRQARQAGQGLSALDLGLETGTERDQTARLRVALAECQRRGSPLVLPPGRFRVGALDLLPGTRLLGAAGATVLEFTGGQAFLRAEGADDLALTGIVLDGGGRPLEGPGDALLHLSGCRGVALHDLVVRGSAKNGISLYGCSGRVSGCTILDAGETGLFSLDARALEIAHNTVSDCANNGIQVWRTAEGEDGTILNANRVERIAAMAGGSGQNGNGINLLRAGGVLVAANRIADCAYSAIRANAASNVQMVSNSCVRIGEVALYAEFGFEGALISANLIDGAATGISVTNFDVGGRLAVVQGNIVRNLVRREHEPEDERGEGIVVEADAAVTGNVIENAATVGLLIGAGRYLRDVTASGNLVRNCRVGILISADAPEGALLVSGNMISGALEGAILTLREGRPAGPDLARDGRRTARLAIAGNMAV